MSWLLWLRQEVWYHRHMRCHTAIEWSSDLSQFAIRCTPHGSVCPS